MKTIDPTGKHLHFVTGRLAEHALRSTVEQLADELEFNYSIDVLPITVAALMTPAWIAPRLDLPPRADLVVLPGYCDSDLEPITSITPLPVVNGPRDLRRLGTFLGTSAPDSENYGAHDIEILAEINHAPRLSLAEILRQADLLREAGADLIDLGCDPGTCWKEVGETTRALRDAGHRVSIDSLDPGEIEPAVNSGAELVLSVNSSNCQAALDWGCEVVVIPDEPATLGGLAETIETLAVGGVPLRIDPILEPIGFGFSESLLRYGAIRQQYPDAEMMMGIGNLTELTDVDSAGVNTLLLGFCQELGIRSVLTTQVINWSRSSVRECDLARRLMYHSVQNQVLPKHLEARLVMLRDEEVVESPVEQIAQLARDIRDNNYRVFASGDAVHLVSRDLHLHDADPFAVMEQLRTSNPDGGPGGGLPKNLDAGHAFYLGYEMCKARTALTLGKTYQQDEALEHEHIHVRRHEAAVRLLWLADDRFTPHVEARVDEHRAPGAALEGAQQRMIAPMPEGIDGLHARRVVNVRDGGHRGPWDLQFRQPREGVVTGVRDSYRVVDRRYEQHIRAFLALRHVEVLARAVLQHGWCEWTERFAELDFSVHHRLHVPAAWVADDATRTERAWPELHPSLKPPDHLFVR